MTGMSEQELDDVQKKIETAQAAAHDLADRDVIDPDRVEGRVPRETNDPADDEDQPTTDKG
jgi:hypothetical protein